jgi:hypothetical protein
VLNRAVDQPVSADLRARIFELCDALYESIGLQTSVEKYGASGEERGAFLDFVDYPMNNRWWLEDEFKKVGQLPTEAEKVARLNLLATWEHPGPGSFYDDVGNNAKSPHVLRSEEVVTQYKEEGNPGPTFWWWDNGKSRARLSWQSSMDWPRGVVYEGLDPNATYRIRLTGYGKFLMRLDGDLVASGDRRVEIGEFVEFDVSPKYVADRKLVLTWDRPTDERGLNWRQQSRLSEVWLLKQ